MIWVVLIALAVIVFLSLGGWGLFKRGENKALEKVAEKEERKKEIKKAVEEKLREVSVTTEDTSQPAEADEQEAEGPRYPEGVPPWPGDIDVRDYNVDPKKSKVYVQPSVILNDGIMRARVFVLARGVNGKPAPHVPGIFIHNGPDDFLFGPGIEPERAREAGNEKYMKALLIEGDVDDGFSPYTKHGFWTDDQGQWEGFITLRTPSDEKFLTTALHMDLGGRELSGPGSSIVVQFHPPEYFENHPRFVDYWEDVIDEVRFESLARSLYDEYGDKEGELPNPDPEG